MTTMTLMVDNKNIDLLEAFKILASKFEGVSFEIHKEESKKEVLNSFSKVLKDIKSGNAIKNARPIEDLYKEFLDD